VYRPGAKNIGIYPVYSIKRQKTALRGQKMGIFKKKPLLLEEAEKTGA
jgi:hypothetical protein